MKRITLILLFIPFIINGQDIGGDYYIAHPDSTYSGMNAASDSNDGSYANPWATFDHAFDIIGAGDTVYARGGTYNVTESTYLAASGTAGNKICIFNYPNEVPIIDGSGSGDDQGINVINSSYIYIKGITCQNFPQASINHYAAGFAVTTSENVTLEMCIAHDIGSRGFTIYGSDSVRIINCDSYNVVDSLSTAPGNAGDGFIVMPYYTHPAADTVHWAYFHGCRAWHVSDDCWDVHDEGTIVIDSCWAFLGGGYPEYAYGNGIKLGLSIVNPFDKVARVIKNSIMVFNRGAGAVTNDNNAVAVRGSNIYNNVTAFNGINGGNGAGFAIYNTNDTDAKELTRIYKNNIAYNNDGGAILLGGSALYTHSYNTWDGGGTVTAADFGGPLDSASIINALLGDRLSDGSLPLVENLYLSEGSDLIDAGVDVGYDYNGSAPDIGAFEMNPPTPDPPATGYRMNANGKSFTNGYGKILLGR